MAQNIWKAQKHEKAADDLVKKYMKDLPKKVRNEISLIQFLSRWLCCHDVYGSFVKSITK